MSTPTTDAIHATLLQEHGEGQSDRISAGLERVARLWQDGDGDQAQFEAFCQQHFISDEADRTRLLDRFEILLTTVHGHLTEIGRDLRRWSDLRGDDFEGLDSLLATFAPAPDLSDQFYRQKLAFIALLNFPRPDLATMLAEGDDWSVDEWAAVRVGKAFGPRIPVAVNDLARELGHKSNHWVASFHVPVGGLVDEDGRKPFEADRKLLAHWLIREEVRSGYAEDHGLEKQRALMWVMKRQIDGTIPQCVMDGSTATWDPVANTLDGQTCTDPIGPERYERWLDCFTVAKAYDEHHHEHPTAIARKFELAREMPEAEVEQLLIDLLSAPIRGAIAERVKDALGRPLEAHDIYFDELAPSPPVDDLNRMVRERIGDNIGMQDKLPEILRGLGFPDEDAEFLGTRVQVEIARGSGHAMRPGMPQYAAWLRTNSLPDDLGWDGFDTGMHELGHNLEQLISTHWVPRPMLRNVPNTACTEAFAFLYQSKAADVLGVEADPSQPDAWTMDTVQTMLDACQIAGPALVDLYAWRWLYANPDADAPAFRDAVIDIATDLWDRFYAEYYGEDPYHILAAYQHMVAHPLYLPDYAIGHVQSQLIRTHMRTRDLAAETKRICSIGCFTPDLWTRKAVGSPISVEPMIKDVEEALSTLSTSVST